MKGVELGFYFAAALVFSVVGQAEDDVAVGIESDSVVKKNEAFAGDVSFATPHVKVTAWELRDQTDAHNELVFKREWLLMTGEAPLTLSVNVLDVCEMETGRGVIFVRKAPLPHARVDKRPDFKVMSGNPVVVKVPDTAYPCERIAYSGGAIGRHRALMRASRKWREYVPGRDGLLLSNTWGDRARDSHLNEKFMLNEIAVAADLGVDVVQIDDGWQKGRTANSSLSNGNGVWNGYWSADPEFWAADTNRFPNGLAPLAEAVRKNGMSLGLWFGPDSSQDAANWEKDAGLLLDYWKRFGVRYYKIDSLKSMSATALRNQRALFDKVLKASNGEVTFDLDVTAEIRPGYFGLPEVGPVFVENRYTDWGKYYPHQTLRNLWSLSEVVDPVRLRMEFLNLERNQGKYRNDPLAPSKWSPDAVFASVMVSSPLAWFELSGLSAETRKSLKPIISTWRRERECMHSGVTFPIGSRPDGYAWTGFLVASGDGKGGYAIVFREKNKSPNWEFDFDGMIPPVSRCEILAGKGTATLKRDSLLVEIPEQFGFVWVKLFSD